MADAEPTCEHDPVYRVTSGRAESGPHASTYVCDRIGCMHDAMRWARDRTGLEPAVVKLRA